MLVRAFAEGYDNMADDPRVVKLASHVQKYNDLLRQYGLSDHQAYACFPRSCTSLRVFLGGVWAPGQ